MIFFIIDPIIFPDQTFINNDQLDDLKSHYPKFINDNEKKWSKLNHLFKDVYEEIIRIIGFSDTDFEPDKNSLIFSNQKNRNRQNSKYKF